MKKLSLQRFLKENEQEQLTTQQVHLSPVQKIVQQRRNALGPHRASIRQLNNEVVPLLYDIVETIRLSIGALKTKQALEASQKLLQLATKLNDVLSHVPLIESKLNEDHKNVLEQLAELAIEYANKAGFQATLAIRGGDYEEAIKLLEKGIRNFNVSIENLKKHILQQR